MGVPVWRVAAAAALVLVTAIPSGADDDSQEMQTGSVLDSGATPAYRLGVGRLDGVAGLEVTRSDRSVTRPVAQASGAPAGAAAPPGAKPGAEGPSASELNKQLSNPVHQPVVPDVSVQQLPAGQ